MRKRQGRGRDVRRLAGSEGCDANENLGRHNVSCRWSSALMLMSKNGGSVLKGATGAPCDVFLVEGLLVVELISV